MDKFEEFETKVTGWIRRHKFAVLFVVTILIAITSVALMIALLTGTVCMNLAYIMEAGGFAGNQTTILNNPYPVSAEQMKAWDTIIMPAATITFNWLGIVIVFLIVGDILVLFYFIIREAYRMKRNHDLMLSPPENL